MDNLHAYPLRDEMVPRQQISTFNIFVQQKILLKGSYSKCYSSPRIYLLFIKCIIGFRPFSLVSCYVIHIGYKTFIFTSLKSNYVISIIN